MRCIAGKITAAAAAGRCQGLRRAPLAASVSYINNGNSHAPNLRAYYSSPARGSVEGRTAIVTGSSRGIGKAIALRLAADGYNICINDIPANQKGCEDVASEIQGLGRKVCVAIADVTKRSEVKDMVQTTVKLLGPLDTMYDLFFPSAVFYYGRKPRRKLTR